MQKSMSKLCKDVVAEGTVLLKNLNNLLPLSKGTKLAVFGRMQTGYYISGTGSGSGASLKNPPCIIEELEKNINLCIDRELVDLYALWVEKHPFIDGAGVWAGEPWFQEEMPLDDDTVRNAAKRNDVALIIIGRTAGEDHDNADEKGSYRLTDAEKSMFKTVTGRFDILGTP